jgi:hypothetical protein
MHVIDIVTTAQDRTSILIRVGPDAWSDSPDEHFILRHKMDTYVEYIESGDFFEDAPDAKGHPVRFRFANVAPIPDAILKTIEQLQTRLREEHGIPLELTHL